MIVVLDTNVLVSGLMFSANPPGRILDLIRARRLRLAVDDRIFAEYSEFLARPRFSRYFTAEDRERVLGIVRFDALHVVCSERILGLPDPDDACFAETSIAAEAPLVTGNLRHFPPAVRSRVRVQTPTQFLEAFHTA